MRKKLIKAECYECEESKGNCVEVGRDGNYVCLDCIEFICELYDTKHVNVTNTYKVKQRTEKIDPNNVPF